MKTRLDARPPLGSSPTPSRRRVRCSCSSWPESANRDLARHPLALAAGHRQPGQRGRRRDGAAPRPVETDTEWGTLSYNDPQTIYDHLTHTITRLPKVGRVIRRATRCSKVDGQPAETSFRSGAVITATHTNCLLRAELEDVMPAVLADSR